MSSTSATMFTAPGAATAPGPAYSSRRAERETEAARFAAWYDRVGQARLGVFGVAIGLAGLAFGLRLLSPLWLGVPAVAFVLLLIAFDRVGRRWRREQRAARFYARGLERIEERWQGRGEPGTRYLDENHPFAVDLDLFGPASVFERLCTAQTRAGQDTLADWLRRPADPAEVGARQAAVQELTPNLGLREDLALAGSDRLAAADFTGLIGWAEAPVVLPLGAIRWVVTGVGVLNLTTLLAWLGGVSVIPFAASTVVSLLLVLPLSARVKHVLGPVERIERELGLLVGLLKRVESESFTSQRLGSLQAALRCEGRRPSEQIAELFRLIVLLNSRQNQLFAPAAVLLLWGTQMALAFEGWRARSGRFVRRWVEAIGAFEALSALAGYAFENPADVYPEVVAGGTPFVKAEALGHPLLPLGRCVRNDVAIGDPVRLVLVSGSNMSGKSTLLRNIGVNVVLALAGAPVRARRLTLTPVSLGATLRVQDSLQAGKSRFYAEITRIRQIVDLAAGTPPLLFLLDEIFHGTNSHDRLIGAEAVIRKLLAANAVGLVTTHDLALTKTAEHLGPAAVNVHFADQFVDGQMHFDYRMRPGVVPHSNALALMRAVGLEV